MPNPESRPVYVVLGMHRSGTSATTLLLSGASANGLPRDLRPADAYNERGYFESQKITMLNTARLNASGSAWDDPFIFPMRKWPDEGEARFRGHARTLLEQEFDLAAEAPILKDPRLSVLLPAWRPVFADLGLAPRCVVCVRHPLAVAASLRKREGFASEKSVLLWINYMLGALIYSASSPRVIVSYDALIADWRAVAARIATTLGAPSAVEDPGRAAMLDQQLNVELRHHEPAGSLADLGWIGRLASELYDALANSPAAGPASEVSLDPIMQILAAKRLEWGAVVSPISRDLDLARNELVRLRGLLAEQDDRAGASSPITR